MIFHLGFVPAGADTELDATVRDLIETGDRFGTVEWIVLWDETDGGAEPNPLGNGRRRGERDEGIQHARILPGNGVDAGKIRRCWQVGVFGHPK